MLRSLRWIAALAYGLGLTLLLLAPPSPTPIHLFPHADKLAHFLALGLLAFALARAMTHPASPRVPRLALVVAILASASYAVAIEFIQPRFHRTYDVMDMLAGSLGILVFAFSWVALRPRFRLLS